MEFTKVEMYAAIRRDARLEDLSIRALADRYRVHRRTVRHALACAAPPARKTPARAAPKLESGLGGIFGRLADPIVQRAQGRTIRANLDTLAELLLEQPNA